MVKNMNSSTISLTGLASHLVYVGLLDSNAAMHALLQANQQQIEFITYLVQEKILSAKSILEVCAKNFNLPVANLKSYQPKELDKTLLNPEIIRRYRVLPLKKHNNQLHIALSDPTNRNTLSTITFYTNLQIVPFLAAEDELTDFIKEYLKEPLASKHLELSLLKELSLEEHSLNIQENAIHYDEPLIRFVDHIIQHALQQCASDIHIEPYGITCRVRYRQDGILQQIAEIPIQLAARLVTRLKVMAKLDIAERRLPQDGRFQSHHTDIRINTCPTLFGEKVVLRLLNSSNMSLAISDLGMTPKQEKIFLKHISQPQGLILVTGPTGSGKTVTLYSALHYLNLPEKNISTVEDPVEIQLKGINQVNINPKTNLTFASALKTFLRQDPDIIMVGEIRDTETANIAIQAAQTGHLVLSTLHTNSALESITRIQSMNIAAYNIANAITLIIAQRLIRKLCDYCKQEEYIPKNILIPNSDEILIKIYRAVGCQHCLSGYHGRIGIYEFLPINTALGQQILQQTSSLSLLQQAQREGFQTLRSIGIENVLQGITSLSEINRVTIQ
jgi:type IV pilus assembly protein PilB